jgi:hypothetical protein
LPVPPGGAARAMNVASSSVMFIMRTNCEPRITD